MDLRDTYETDNYYYCGYRIIGNFRLNHWSERLIGSRLTKLIYNNRGRKRRNKAGYAEFCRLKDSMPAGLKANCT